VVEGDSPQLWRLAVSATWSFIMAPPFCLYRPFFIPFFFLLPVLQSLLVFFLSSTLPARSLFRFFSSYASCWLLPALHPTLHFPFPRLCSEHSPPMLSIGSHYNPPYPYPPYTQPIFIYISVHHTHFNHEDGGSMVL
jgi:hypothetical protein